MRVLLQVIKVHAIEVGADDAEDAIKKAYQLQTTEIEATGELIDAMTDHAEIEEEVESNVTLHGSLRKET